MQECKGKCSKFPLIRHAKFFYKLGAIFCPTCGVHFMKFFNNRLCPCCSTPVRSKSKNTKTKIKIYIE